MTENTLSRPASTNAASLKPGRRRLLTLGAIGDSKWIKRQIDRLRDVLASELERRGVEVGIAEACLLQSVCRHERHAQLVQRWLRQRGDDLDDDLKLRFSKEVCEASDRRDRALEKLGLKPSAAAGCAWDVALAAEATTTPNTPDATAGHVDAQEGQQQ